MDCSDLVSNSWLAGFIVVNSGFFVSFSEPNKSKSSSIIKNFRIACSLNIEQRMTDPISKLIYEYLFLKISSFLKCKLEISKHNVNKNYIKVRAYNQTSLKIVLNYFDQYNLYSSKYLDYKDWSKIVLALLKKQIIYQKINWLF